jgi:topoisomerase-4 subunit B
VEGAAHDAFSLWLNQHTELGEKIAQLAIERAAARLKTEKQIVRKKITQGPALPGKLADCSLAGSFAHRAVPGRRRLCRRLRQASARQGFPGHPALARQDPEYLGSRKRARCWDRRKCTTWPWPSAAILASRDISGLRYGKMVILADADSDGLHIATLLSALFLQHFPALVEAGHIFVAMPPLFRVDVGKQVFYALDEEEKRLLLDRIAREKLRGTGQRHPLQGPG